MRVIYAALAATICWCGVAAAQEAQRPTWSVGSVCVYRMGSGTTDGKPSLAYDYTQRVVSVNGNMVTLEYAAGNGKRTFQVTTDGNLVSYGTGTYTPFFPTYVFPMNVGSVWSGKATLSEGSASIPYELSGKAVAWEYVTVPAGKFAAFKIEVKGHYTSQGKQGAVEQTVWYSPEVNRMVKEVFNLKTLAGNPWRVEDKQLASRCN